MAGERWLKSAQILTFGFIPVFLMPLRETSWLFMEIHIFAWEHRRAFTSARKFSQWPHLYTTYEATSVFKCLLFEIYCEIWLPAKSVTNHASERCTLKDNDGIWYFTIWLLFYDNSR
jgi:hypothetical protein